LRAELVEIDEQIVAAERALTEAKAQRDRDQSADGIEALAAAIEQVVPGFDAGAAALVAAVTKSPTSIPEAVRFSTSIDTLRREVVSAGVTVMLVKVSPIVTADVPDVAPAALAWMVALPAATPVTTPLVPAVLPTVAAPVGVLVETVQFTEPVTSFVLLSL